MLGKSTEPNTIQRQKYEYMKGVHGVHVAFMCRCGIQFGVSFIHRIFFQKTILYVLRKIHVKTAIMRQSIKGQEHSIHFNQLFKL